MEKTIKSRRDFLKQTAVLVAGAMVARPLSVFAIGGDSIAGYSMQGYSMQGNSMQGYSMQGYSMQGYSMQGYSVYGASTLGLPDSIYDLSDCDADLSPSMFAGMPPALRRRMRNALARDPEAFCEWLLDRLP